MKGDRECAVGCFVGEDGPISCVCGEGGSAGGGGVRGKTVDCRTEQRECDVVAREEKGEFCKGGDNIEFDFGPNEVHGKAVTRGRRGERFVPKGIGEHEVARHDVVHYKRYGRVYREAAPLVPFFPGGEDLASNKSGWCGAGGEVVPGNLVIWDVVPGGFFIREGWVKEHVAVYISAWFCSHAVFRDRRVW